MNRAIFSVLGSMIALASKLRYRRPSRMAEICLDRQSEGFHSPESAQHPAFYRYRESYPRRNGSPRNCCSRAGMNEVQFLFPSEPCKAVKSRSLYVVFLVQKDVRVERRRTCDRLNHEEIDWQYEVCTRSHQKHRNEEEGCIVAFVTEVRRRNE